MYNIHTIAKKIKCFKIKKITIYNNFIETNGSSIYIINVRLLPICIVDCYKTHGSKIDREHENNFKRKYDVQIII